MVITEAIWKEIQKRSITGASIREIARSLSISRDAVSKWRDVAEYPVQGKTSQTSQASQPSQVNVEQLTATEEHYLRRENQRLRSQVSGLLDAQLTRNEFVTFGESMLANPVKVPKWTIKKHKAKSDIATAMAFASDWHLDEIVSPSQMGGCNAFNRAIAEVRVRNFFDNVERLCHGFIKGIEYDGLYLLLGGDLFSGNIHEELKETNESTIIESVLYWAPVIVAGIKYLADRFKHVHVPCVVGNHGRLSRKPIAKNRAQDNFDFLLYNMLAMLLKDDERITWDIAAAADTVFTVQDTDFCLTHGDQFKGGSGISGPATPWALGDHRKRKKFQGIGTPYDMLVFGHWHTLTLGLYGMIVNGALKGYDEYAYISNFPFESPQQALWLVQPGKAVTGRWPVHVLGDTEKYNVHDKEKRQ